MPLYHKLGEIPNKRHTVFKSKSGKYKNSIISNIKKTGEAYYDTYTEIKKGKDKS